MYCLESFCVWKIVKHFYTFKSEPVNFVLIQQKNGPDRTGSGYGSAKLKKTVRIEPDPDMDPQNFKKTVRIEPDPDMDPQNKKNKKKKY